MKVADPNTVLVAVSNGQFFNSFNDEVPLGPWLKSALRYVA